jgi:type II secretory pathway predicted ATPase ExeA
MRVEVMQRYGLTQPLSQAGYYETQHHQQLIKDIKGAILEGRLMVLLQKSKSAMFDDYNPLKY